MNLYKSRKKGNSIPVTGISLDKSEIENYMGNTSTVKVIVTPSNATHKNNYQVTIGDVEDADKIGTTFTKEGDTITIHFNGKSGGDEYYFLNGQVGYRQITKNIPVVVSLDGVSAIFYITMRPRGSYQCESTITPIYPMAFYKIKNSTSNSNNVQLLQQGNPGVDARGILSVDDTLSEYRSALDRYYYNHVSWQFYDAMVSFSKVVHKTLTTSVTYNDKYHLFAFGEIGCSLSSYDKQNGNSIINLGSDTYPYIMSNPSILNQQDYLSRTIVKNVYNGNISSLKMELNEDCVNNAGNYAWLGDVDDSSDEVIPIISLPYDLSVNKLGTYNNKDYYALDFTNTSSTKLSSIALGSVIYDLDGIRNGEMNLYDNNIQTDMNSIYVKTNQSVEVSVKMFNVNDSFNQNFNVSISNSNVTATVNGNVIVFTGVSEGSSIATITNTSNGITKQRDIEIRVGA